VRCFDPCCRALRFGSPEGLQVPNFGNVSFILTLGQSEVATPKKNGKLRICINFKKLNASTKKDPYPLSFIDEVLNIVTWYELYSFLDGYSRYHQISIAQ
jgi:hypothetical protein